MVLPEIPWHEVVTGAAAYVLLGEVWFCRPLVDRLWRRFAPDLPDGIRRDWPAYAMSFIYGFVMVWLLSLVLGTLSVTRFALGCGVGAAVLVLTKTFSSLTYARRRPIGTPAWWIHAAYQLLALSALGGALAVWR